MSEIVKRVFKLHHFHISDHARLMQAITSPKTSICVYSCWGICIFKTLGSLPPPHPPHPHSTYYFLSEDSCYQWNEGRRHQNKQTRQLAKHTRTNMYSKNHSSCAVFSTSEVEVPLLLLYERLALLIY